MQLADLRAESVAFWTFCLAQILGYIDIAQREGARLLAGGKQHGTKGYFVSSSGVLQRVGAAQR